MKQTEPDITLAEQWALLRWKARHIGAFVEDTIADLTPRHSGQPDHVRRSCGFLHGWAGVALHTLAGILAAIAVGRSR